MEQPRPDTFVVRHRLWRVWLRMALCLQGLALVVACVNAAYCAANNDPILKAGYYTGVVLVFSVSAACLATPISLLYWWSVRFLLSVEGIHSLPPVAPSGYPIFIPPFYFYGVPGAARLPSPLVIPAIYWNRVAVVQRKRDWLVGRWLHIVSEYGNGITLPEQPADIQGFREAVERFAGPHHPLALAIAAVLGE